MYVDGLEKQLPSPSKEPEGDERGGEGTRQSPSSVLPEYSGRPPPDPFSIPLRPEFSYPSGAPGRRLPLAT